MRSLVRIMVIAILLILPAPSWADKELQVPLDWEELLAGEELPLEFTQRVTTLFDHRETVTLDHVRRWSRTHWLVTRQPDNHGAIIFGSSSLGSWALATDSNVMYESDQELSLHVLLNPISFGPPRPLPRLISKDEQPEGSSWIVEREFFDLGVARLWIDAQKHRLVKEEFRDEEGKILYRLKRTDFRPVPDSDVENRRRNARAIARRIFPNQPEWWHHVLLSRLQREQADILLPTRLPPGMLLVAAITEGDGTDHLSYSDGSQVISIFERKAQARIRDHFKQAPSFTIFTTERQGRAITVIGPLDRSQMEEIVDSLQHLAEMMNEEENE